MEVAPVGIPSGVANWDPGFRITGRATRLVECVGLLTVPVNVYLATTLLKLIGLNPNCGHIRG